MTFLNALLVGVALQPVIHAGVTHLLVVKRNIPPCIGEWALPGGYAENGDTTLQTAARELEEETGLVQDIQGIDADVVHVFRQVVVESNTVKGALSADPRNHLVQFVTLPPVAYEQINLSFACDETQEVTLARLENGGLVDLNGAGMTLCFPLHQTAAIQFLSGRV